MPEDTVATAEPVAPPPPPSEPAPEPAAATDSADDHAAEPPVHVVSTLPSATTEPLALVAEEINAAPVGSQQASESASAAGEASRARGRAIQAGGVIGGVLPRGDLKPGMALQLVGTAPLSLLGLPDRWDLGLGALALDVVFAAGWSPLRQQAPALIPGRGRTELIQSSQVFPFDLGALMSLDFGAPLLPYATFGLTAELTQTTMQAFSTPSQTTRDFAVGAAVGIGAYLPLGRGHLVGELRYREVRADIGALQDVGEGTFSATTFQLGYLMSL